MELRPIQLVVIIVLLLVMLLSVCFPYLITVLPEGKQQTLGNSCVTGLGILILLAGIVFAVDAFINDVLR